MHRAPLPLVLAAPLACAPEGTAPADDTASADADAAVSGDPLPSWRDGDAKRSILAFVAAVSDPDSPEHVPPGSRFATFDNDGTLWPEHPLVQLLFARSRFDRLAPEHPEWRTEQPFRALLENDSATIATFGIEEVLRLLAATHTGMTQEEFAAAADSFFATASYPPFGVPITDIAYQPQVELLRLLRDNDFKVYIVSGGTIEFMRAVSERIYGIPREHVIGTRAVYEMQERDGRAVLMRIPRIATNNDRAEKAVNISAVIGQRPILAVGNERSGGDVEMLRYSQGSPHRSLQIIIDHDDAEREFSYDEPDNRSLGAAAANGWTVVSMARDWERIFSFR